MDGYAFIVTLCLIGMAELGDKTQMLTFGFATRYPIRTVLFAITLATCVLMGVAVMVGKLVNQYIPIFYVHLVSGILFICFGILTLRNDNDNDKSEYIGIDEPRRTAFWIVFTGFLLAELGDKTQVTTLALTAKYGSPVSVWLGATAAMVGVNSLSVFIGTWIKNRLPERRVKKVAGILFLLFGILTLVTVFVKNFTLHNPAGGGNLTLLN